MIFFKDGTYTPDYICQGGKYFFNQGCNQNGVFHGWVSMLAPKHVAKEYLATIVIHCPNPKVGTVSQTQEKNCSLVKIKVFHIFKKCSFL